MTAIHTQGGDETGIDRYPPLTMMLLTLLCIGLVVNTALLVYILVWDIFLPRDVITVSAAALSLLSMGGVARQAKWGVGCAIAKCMLDVSMQCIYLADASPISVLSATIIILLAVKEYHHIAQYQHALAQYLISM
jgi:hypothetical protein